jgi:hypothetical protein
MTRVCQAYFTQFFLDGFFNADPHVGVCVCVWVWVLLESACVCVYVCVCGSRVRGCFVYATFV